MKRKFYTIRVTREEWLKLPKWIRRRAYRDRAEERKTLAFQALMDGDQ